MIIVWNVTEYGSGKWKSGVILIDVKEWTALSTVTKGAKSISWEIVVLRVKNFFILVYLARRVSDRHWGASDFQMLIVLGERENLF